MGKAAMCIQMLQCLNSGRVYKISELAELLETNPRNIIEYKRELEEVGYYIISVPGKNGGYKLDKTRTFPSLKLSDTEEGVISAAVSYLESREDFLERRQFQNVMAKIFSSLKHNVPLHETFNIQGYTLSMSSEDLRERYRAAESCIKNKHVLQIDFLSNDNVIRRRDVHPYKLFIMNNAWFILGHCVQTQKVMYFKLNRIMYFAETSEKFRIPLYYNERDYIDENGLKKGGDWSDTADSGQNEWVHIKLHFTGRPAMYIKEYQYGKNQEVTQIDKDNTVLECDMHYRYNTVRFVLQFGTDCKVIEPQWLKEEVVAICKKVAEGGKNQ